MWLRPRHLEEFKSLLMQYIHACHRVYSQSLPMGDDDAFAHLWHAMYLVIINSMQNLN